MSADLKAYSHQPRCWPNRKVFHKQEVMIVRLRFECKFDLKGLRSEFARQRGLKLALDTIYKILVCHGRISSGDLG